MDDSEFPTKPAEPSHRKGMTVIEGGKSVRGEGAANGPAFGAGMKAEEARGERKALTPEEIGEMHYRPEPR